MAFKTSVAAAGAFALAALLATPALALESEPLPYDDPVVPPGQEELLSTMLGRGATLPDNCKFAGGGADGPLIRSTYSCPSGEVVYHIVHPDNATDAATQTERFALMIESGAPPATLSNALASLVRTNEGNFEWLWLTSPADAAESGEDGEDSPGEDADW